jgi:hypothetical protein
MGIAEVFTYTYFWSSPDLNLEEYTNVNTQYLSFSSSLVPDSIIQVTLTITKFNSEGQQVAQESQILSIEIINTIPESFSDTPATATPNKGVALDKMFELKADGWVAPELPDTPQLQYQFMAKLENGKEVPLSARSSNPTLQTYVPANAAVVLSVFNVDGAFSKAELPVSVSPSTVSSGTSVECIVSTTLTNQFANAITQENYVAAAQILDMLSSLVNSVPAPSVIPACGISGSIYLKSLSRLDINTGLFGMLFDLESTATSAIPAGVSGSSLASFFAYHLARMLFTTPTQYITTDVLERAEALLEKTVQLLNEPTITEIDMHEMSPSITALADAIIGSFSSPCAQIHRVLSQLQLALSYQITPAVPGEVAHHADGQYIQGVARRVLKSSPEAVQGIYTGLDLNAETLRAVEFEWVDVIIVSLTAESGCSNIAGHIVSPVTSVQLLVADGSVISVHGLVEFTLAHDLDLGHGDLVCVWRAESEWMYQGCTASLDDAEPGVVRCKCDQHVKSLTQIAAIQLPSLDIIYSDFAGTIAGFAIVVLCYVALVYYSKLSQGVPMSLLVPMSLQCVGCTFHLLTSLSMTISMSSSLELIFHFIGAFFALLGFVLYIWKYRMKRFMQYKLELTIGVVALTSLLVVLCTTAVSLTSFSALLWVALESDLLLLVNFFLALHQRKSGTLLPVIKVGESSRTMGIAEDDQ